MAKLVLGVALICVASVLVAGCGAGDVGHAVGIAGPKSVDELRSETTLREFSNALQDEDWSRACGRMIPAAVDQLFSLAGGSAAQASGKESEICEPLIEGIFKGGDVPDLQPKKVTRQNNRVVVETTAGETFVLSKDALDIDHFPPPQQKR